MMHMSEFLLLIILLLLVQGRFIADNAPIDQKEDQEEKKSRQKQNHDSISESVVINSISSEDLIDTTCQY